MAYWTSTIEETVERYAPALGQPMPGDFRDWLRLYADCAPTTSNQGSHQVPFQRWFRFKEAFSPKFVADTIGSMPYPVRHCVDPFSGSGTTALTCSFLGIDSTSIEVNPFLADLAAAKLTPPNASRLFDAYARLVSDLTIMDEDRRPPAGMPKTLREPGDGGRHVFDAEVFDVARMLGRRLRATGTLEARLLAVLLGGVLVHNSNVVINGKGRRYRGSWRDRGRTASHLLADLDDAVAAAADDIIRFPVRPAARHAVLVGDARRRIADVEPADLAIFSPPYPNSFDYTDVYNLELWMLGYLDGANGNADLRNETLRSHVQIKRAGRSTPSRSTKLVDTVEQLRAEADTLWNPHIPDMIDAYFEDIETILDELVPKLARGRRAVMVVGDCQYAGVHVDVAGIIAESLADSDYRLQSRGVVRSMRNSSQHGGTFELREHCIVLERV